MNFWRSVHRFLPSGLAPCLALFLAVLPPTGSAAAAGAVTSIPQPGALQSSTSSSTASSKSSTPMTSAGKLPGVSAAETLSQITGIAISPALGVSAVGAWRYFHTPAAQRDRLPWFAQPWFWGPALLVVILALVKDSAGPVIPTTLKKPFDIAELFENKLSGLIATGAVIPLAMSIFQSIQPSTAALAGAGLGVIDFSPLWNLLMVPIALLVYGAVFLVSHVIQVLIIISPFATVDAGLKALRLALLSSVAATSMANSSLGAVWSGLIVLICLPLAGWALRMLVFGHVFAWDIVTFRRRRTVPAATDNRAFLATKLGRVPRRTYGTLARKADGALMFHFRPWLVLAPKTVPLPDGSHAIGRGFFHPQLLHLQNSAESGEEVHELLHFPPRYSGHEEALGQAYGIPEIRDVGLMAVWAWFRNLFHGGKPTTRTAG